MDLLTLPVGLFLSILAVILAYMSWSKAASYNRNNIEQLLQNRFVNRTFGHQYEFHVALSYTHTKDGVSVFPRSIEKLKQEPLPYTTPTANIIVHGHIHGIESQHLRRVEEIDASDGILYPFDNELGKEHSIESVTFQGKGLRMEFKTSEVETVRSALDEIDEIIDVILKQNHEAHTEVPSEVFSDLSGKDHFATIDWEEISEGLENDDTGKQK